MGGMGKQSLYALPARPSKWKLGILSGSERLPSTSSFEMNVQNRTALILPVQLNVLHASDLSCTCSSYLMINYERETYSEFTAVCSNIITTVYKERKITECCLSALLLQN